MKEYTRKIIVVTAFAATVTLSIYQRIQINLANDTINELKAQMLSPWGQFGNQTVNSAPQPGLTYNSTSKR